MTITVGDLVDAFRKIHNLPISPYEEYGPFYDHDCVHALAALGSSVADEQRVVALQYALFYEGTRFSRNFATVYANEKAVLVDLFDLTKISLAKETDSNSALAEAYKAELQAPPVSDAEITELYELGKKLKSALVAQIGEGYDEIDDDVLSEKLSRLDAASLDVSAEVAAIKRKYATPESIAVERQLANAFNARAKAEGREAALEAGRPWRPPVAQMVMA